MKHKNKFKKTIIILLTIILFCFMSMGFVKRNNYYVSSDRNFFSFISMLRYGLIDAPIQTINGIAKDAATMWDVRYENDALRGQLETSYHWQSRVNALEKEVKELKELNQLDTTYSEFSQTKARVKGRSQEQWDSVVTIDKGSEQGITVNDGVMSPKGLIGKVISVDKNQSLVSLLTSNDSFSNVTVQIEVAKGQYAQGILNSYDLERNLFSVVLLDANATIAPDMVVSTASISSIYPVGLFVGKVHSIKNVADSVGVLVYVESAVDFNDIGYVSVVKKP